MSFFIASKAPHLVKGHDEGRLLLLEQVDGLDGLGLQAVHDVHHQDGDVAQAAASAPQVGEGLVTCVQAEFAYGSSDEEGNRGPGETRTTGEDRKENSIHEGKFWSLHVSAA